MQKSYRPNDDEAAVAMTVARRRGSFNGNQSALPGDDPLREPENAAARLENDYLSVLAEIAVSRMLNRCWTGCGIGPAGELDVGGLVQVRATAEQRYGLLVKATDKDDEPVALVWVNKANRVCSFMGWRMSEHVKANGRARHEGTPKLCWILAQQHLLPFEELRQLVLRREWVADYEKGSSDGQVE